MRKDLIIINIFLVLFLNQQLKSYSIKRDFINNQLHSMWINQNWALKILNRQFLTLKGHKYIKVKFQTVIKKIEL